MAARHDIPDPAAARRRRDARAALGGLLALACLAPLATGWMRLPRGPVAGGAPGPVTVDLARDPAWRLRLLPGIGVLRASAIVWDRERNGPARRLEDLLRVPGIGRGTLRGLAETPGLRVVLDGEPVLRCAHERDPRAP